jgi:hypothetical protein
MAALTNVLHALKRVGVNRVYRSLEPMLPGWFNKRVAAMSDKYIFKALVRVEEIIPQYKRAAEYLIDNVGRDGLGDYLEFGVCHGTSMSCMHRVLNKLDLGDVRMFGFDSFEGLPEVAAEESNQWVPGEFAAPIEETRAYLTERGVDWNKTFLVKGWYAETLTPELVETHHIEKASLIMVDCDIYASSKEALEFCKPLIKDKSVVFFDDWRSTSQMGEEMAFNEFLEENPHFRVERFGSYKPNGEIYLIENTSFN